MSSPSTASPSTSRNVASASLPLLAPGGRLALMASLAGIAGGYGYTAYAASKFGMRGFADALRAEEHQFGVRVTSVHPSRTATPMQAKVHGQEGTAYDEKRFVSAVSVAATIVHVLDLPADATIPELTIRTAP